MVKGHFQDDSWAFNPESRSLSPEEGTRREATGNKKEPTVQVENPTERYLKDVGRTGEGYIEIHTNERTKQLLITGKVFSIQSKGNLIIVHYLAKQKTIVTSHNNTSMESDVTKSCGINVL